MSVEAVSTEIDNSGRTMGMLAIAAAPGALLVSPTMFPLASFMFAMFGLTVATPKNRIYSYAGVAVSVTCGIIGYYFNTPIV